MNKEIRKPKKTDQQTVEKGFQIINKIMRDHPEIEPTLWASICWSTIVQGYIKCGFSYEEFCIQFNEVKESYKSWWE